MSFFYKVFCQCGMELFTQMCSENEHTGSVPQYRTTQTHPPSGKREKNETNSKVREKGFEPQNYY